MRRRARAPEVQLARAGERTTLLIGDSPLAEVRFKASVFDGSAAGRVDLETVHGPRTHTLSDDNRLETDGLISLSVVPEQDTAITFVPANPPQLNATVALAGFAVLGAIGWTAWDMLAG